jgi:ABC-type nitrate/sulfonate/bicarbonate transport system substrate-binding protein
VCNQRSGFSSIEYKEISMKRVDISIVATVSFTAALKTLVSAALCVTTLSAAAQTPIRISTQPGLYFTLPLHVATANGYWKDAGLTPSILPFAAGVPQIKANADWDVGLTGVVPALIGAKDFNLITIGIVDDQSRTNALLARKEFVEKVKAEKQIPNGTKFAVTLNSSADYAAQTCLALWGGKNKGDMVYKGAGQGDVIKAGAAGEADVVGLWAPNLYTMQEKHGFVPFCTGKDFSPGIFGTVVANRAYATTNPALVSKFLAVLMRSINWMKDNPEKAQALLIATAGKDGIVISASAAKSDVELRPIFNLKQQLEIMGSNSTNANDSVAGKSFYSINVFLNEGKTGTRTMRPAAFVDVSYLKRVNDDPELQKMANAK